MGTFAPRFAWLKAQLRNADSGEVIPGFGFAECDALEEDSPGSPDSRHDRVRPFLIVEDVKVAAK